MKNYNKIIILSLLMLTFGIAQASIDMGIYQQNYNVTSDESILLLQAGTEYKLKFKGISKNVDETTLDNATLPNGLLEIRHDEHKTMGSSTIHVVQVAEDAPAYTGYIHLVTYDGDGGDRRKHDEHYIRTIIVGRSNISTRSQPVCGEVNFGKDDRYVIDFKNQDQLNAANAKFISNGRCR